MNNIKINVEDVSDVLITTNSIIKTYGPRLPGTDSCIKAAEHLKKELAKYCDKVFETNFTQHPGAFFYIPTILAIAYFLGSILFVINFIHAALLVYFLGLVYLLSQFIFFGNTFDKFFRAKPGKNVFGIIEPSRELKQQIIISSHHDSPYICNFLRANQKLYAFRLFIPIIFYLFIFISIIIISFSNEIRENSSFSTVLFGSIVTGSIFALPLFWYNSRKGSPGAGDNLLSSVIGIKISEVIKKNANRLLHTRIIVLSNDGEEIGQKGVQAFINQNKELLNECPTYVLNLDSIFKYEDLALLISDRNGTIQLSEQLGDEILNIANQLGYKVTKKKFPLGGGGTDAAHFSKTDIKSISLIGISTDLIRDNMFYHTANDIVDNLDANAIEAAINIVLNDIYYKDSIVV
ncbi:MAG: M28 family peptidase [Ignavibacteria bacterium]|jgi:hypothetical protein